MTVELRLSINSTNLDSTGSHRIKHSMIILPASWTLFSGLGEYAVSFRLSAYNAHLQPSDKRIDIKLPTPPPPVSLYHAQPQPLSSKQCSKLPRLGKIPNKTARSPQQNLERETNGFNANQTVCYSLRAECERKLAHWTFFILIEK